MNVFCFLFSVFVFFFYFFLRPATVLIFFNAFVLYFHLEHVQRISFCRCFFIFNPAVVSVDNGVVLWLKIKNPATTANVVSRCYTTLFLCHSRYYRLPLLIIADKIRYKLNSESIYFATPYTCYYAA